MITNKNRFLIFFTLTIGLFLSGCKDKWEDHNIIQDPVLADNLLSQIKNNADLSKFAEFLSKTGYDKIIASSKTFTVWAPTNKALQSLDQSIVNDTSKLKPFVANHISNQSYFTRMANPSLTIRTLNGKNILFTKTKFEEANIVVPDRYVGNGVLHTIDMGILPKLNSWEYLNNSLASQQKTFLLSLNYTFRDSSRAEVIGIDPKTGIPILKDGTGYFARNYYLQKAADISNEDVRYTFVVLTDAAYSSEKTKISKYFSVNDPIATPARNAFVSDSLTNWNIVKDLVFKGDYALAALPDTLISTDSTRIHLDKGAILQTINVSNGVVYVMNRIDYKMSRKIRPVMIEGENYVSHYGNYGTRSIITRRNPITNVDFRELYFYNTGIANYWIKYQPTLNNLTYKVYWVAVRDFNTTAVAPAVPVMFSQRLAFGTTALMPAFPYKQIDILNYSEVYLGDYTAPGFGKTDTYLVGANSTTNGANSLVLDYIKMVPVLN
jgi:uncharacterized surface protein with fasciclin (FAS1) repeats